jgi:hypothetical protein
MGRTSLLASLLIFCPKIVFINFLTQVFIRFSFDTVLFTVFYPTLSKCNDNYHYDNNETNDNSNVPTNDNSNDKTNDNDDEDFNEENEHECKVASQIGTQDLLDYPNLYPEFRDSGMYHVIYNMK